MSVHSTRKYEGFKTKYIERCRNYMIPTRRLVLEPLDRAIQRGIAFTSLDLSGSQSELYSVRVTDMEVSAICDTLSSEEGRGVITSLNLSKNKITSLGAGALARTLKEPCSITHLDISFNDIRGEGVTQLADGVSKGNNLRSLNIGYNAIEARGGEAILHLIKNCTSLKSLDISGTGLTTEAIWALSVTLYQIGTNIHLESLRLGNPRLFSLHEETTNQLARVLALPGCPLREIDFSKHGMRDGGAQYLAQALRHNTGLESLILHCNSIGVDGTVALAQVLCEGSSTVRHIDLSGNEIGKRGAQELARAVLRNNNLVSLDLRACKIQDESLAVIASALPHSRSLKKVLLWGNVFGPRATAQFITNELKFRKGYARLPILDTGRDTWSAPVAWELAQEGRTSESAAPVQQVVEVKPDVGLNAEHGFFRKENHQAQAAPDGIYGQIKFDFGVNVDKSNSYCFRS